MEEELQKNQEVAAAEDAGGAEPAPAEAEPMQPMEADEEQAEEAAEDAGGQEAQAEGAAEDAAPQGQAQGEQEDKEEEEEEKEEQKEQAENPEGAGPKEEGDNLAGDDVNQEIAKVAAEAGVENEEEEDQGDPDRAFDTLEDLKKLGGENGNGNNEGDDKDTSEQVLKDRKAVMQLRKGNLYKAVIFARMLENGENPAGEQQQIEARQPGGGGRFNRFLNSSKLDKAEKAIRLTNAATGLAGMADSNFSDSFISRLASKANNIMALVKSIRGIVKKLKAFKQNSTSPTKKAFAVIGLIADFGTAVSKGAAIAQKVFARKGWHGLASVMSHLSSFAGIVGQVAALTSVSKSLKDVVEATAPIKKAQKEEEGNVEAVLKKYEINVGTEDGAGQAEKGKAGKGKNEKEAKSHRLRKKNALKEKVMSALERPDISEEDKAVLASYLGRARILSKRKVAIANVATGLITSALGLGATFSKTAAAHTEGDAQISATKHAVGFGAMTNIMMLGSTISMDIAQKRVNKGPDEKEGSLIKEGLYGALHDLGSDDKYGLRKISATLAPKEPDKEHVQNAELAMKRYETATKQFQGSGVNFAQLFQATDKEAFKDSLVASL